MDYLNLGCGAHFHPDWTNVNFTSTGTGVIVHNLRDGFPFDNESFDAVYHSHVLEHFPREEGKFFVQECCRVLRPGGILRVVIPDLEKIARLYIRFLEQALMGLPGGADNYHWMLLEMYDQAVRSSSGGEMANYLRQSLIPNKEFVIERVGQEAENIIQALNQAPQIDHPSPKPLSEREEILKGLLGDADYEALQVGRFRQQGEIHQWMYDRYSLAKLLEENGFDQASPCAANKSRIPEFSAFCLDTLPDGCVRKPDSLFMEALKLNKTISSNSSNLALQTRPSAQESAPPQSLSDLAMVQALPQQLGSLQKVVSDLTNDLTMVQALQQQLDSLQSTVSDLTLALQQTQKRAKQVILEASTLTSENALVRDTLPEIVPLSLAEPHPSTQSGEESRYLSHLYRKIEPFTPINVSHTQALLACLNRLNNSEAGSIVYCGDLEAGTAAVLAYVIIHFWPHQRLCLAPSWGLNGEPMQSLDLPRLLTTLSVVNADMTRVAILGAETPYSLSGLSHIYPTYLPQSELFSGSARNVAFPLTQLSMLSIALKHGTEIQQIKPMLEKFLDYLVDGGVVVLDTCHTQEETRIMLDAYLSKHHMRYDAGQSSVMSVWSKTC
ncbi:MAG: methyltransferase domain-containing protein [Cyanothece sp. SIO2G6]|nr:methyltransferase domain-containing protein [Cyanothece sp. SIO2G6]